jgi:hypothetical protein
MIFQHLTSFLSIVAIAAGSGYSMLAQSVVNSPQNVHVYGGWGLAVVGLFTLWKDNKEERAKRDAQAESSLKRSEAQQILFTETIKENTEKTNKTIDALTKSHNIKYNPQQQNK